MKLWPGFRIVCGWCKSLKCRRAPGCAPAFMNCSEQAVWSGFRWFQPIWLELGVPDVGVLACTWVSTKSCPVLFWGDHVHGDVVKLTSQGWVHHCSPTSTTAIVEKIGLGGGVVVVAPHLPVNFLSSADQAESSTVSSELCVHRSAFGQPLGATWHGPVLQPRTSSKSLVFCVEKLFD